MLFDRKLQYQVLKALEEVYPDSQLVSNLPGFANDRNFMGNLFYLQEHGLIEGGDLRQPGQCRSMVDAYITKTGLDFLYDDGGLPAMLGRLKIQFRKDELMDGIDLALKKSDMHDGVRQVVVASLDGLQPEAFEKVIKQFLLVSVHEGNERLAAMVLEEEQGGVE